MKDPCVWCVYSCRRMVTVRAYYCCSQWLY